METFLYTPTKIKPQLYYKLLDTLNTLPEYDPQPRDLTLELNLAAFEKDNEKEINIFL